MGTRNDHWYHTDLAWLIYWIRFLNLEWLKLSPWNYEVRSSYVYNLATVIDKRRRPGRMLITGPTRWLEKSYLLGEHRSDLGRGRDEARLGRRDCCASVYGAAGSRRDPHEMISIYSINDARNDRPTDADFIAKLRRYVQTSVRTYKHTHISSFDLAGWGAVKDETRPSNCREGWKN